MRREWLIGAAALGGLAVGTALYKRRPVVGRTVVYQPSPLPILPSQQPVGTVLISPGPSTLPIPQPTPTIPTPIVPSPILPIPSPVVEVLPHDQTIFGEADSDVITNPERGYRKGMQLMGGDNLAATRAQGYSMVQGYVSLRDFKNGPISDAYLNQLRNRLEELRKAGLKASLRFWYSWSETEADAPRAVVMNHIQQLKPILQDYADVIAVLQAGFIGAWGEWHSSTNGLANDADKRAIVNALLDALPSDRRIQLRYPADLKLFAPGGIVEAMALTGMNARLGHHNDCFMVNQSDAGTYPWNDPERSQMRSYLQGMSKFLAMGGEMCGDVPESGTDPYNRRTPEGQVAELERFAWSFIANDFGGIQRWKDWGIYDTIARRLGYRLELVSSTVPDRSKGNLRLSITLKNSGWAAPYNSRLVKLVLRSTSNPANMAALDISAEPRKWYAGTTQTLLFDKAPNLAPGRYEALLWLPDPYPSIMKRPEYAIRLANKGVWEAATGYNKLNQYVELE